MDNYNDVMTEETLSPQFFIFTKTKLLMIHRFIEEQQSSDSQQPSKSSSENNTRTSLLSDSFDKIKLPGIKNQPFDGLNKQ